MGIGLSTSCFYPLETEKALELAAGVGAKVCEVFFNSMSEIESPFLGRLLAIKENFGLDIPAVHPFFSFAEPYLIFSEYERRFHDSLDFYDRYFEAANILGAKILVIHGARAHSNLPNEFFYERFALLAQRGQAAGIKVAQENVVSYLSGSPDYLLGLNEYMKGQLNLVLDLKQAVRAGHSAFEFIEKLGHNIIHTHLSDHYEHEDCSLPGSGVFDFAAFFKAMQALSYQGHHIIELYRHSFKGNNDLAAALEFLKGQSKI
ncbi:MAG: sugar phosphate isomerase/epimerase [Clostridiales bacterium]|nr:sugar phosphate isomerase/epimerase [Clostridiales bacterium]